MALFFNKKESKMSDGYATRAVSIMGEVFLSI